MPLSLLNHSALALFAQRTRIPTSARSIGFCAIWVCISSSSAHIVVELTYYYTALTTTVSIAVRTKRHLHAISRTCETIV
jgi:hypothetical protein